MKRRFPSVTYRDCGVGGFQCSVRLGVISGYQFFGAVLVVNLDFHARSAEIVARNIFCLGRRSDYLDPVDDSLLHYVADELDKLHQFVGKILVDVT